VLNIFKHVSPFFIVSMPLVVLVVAGDGSGSSKLVRRHKNSLL